MPVTIHVNIILKDLQRTNLTNVVNTRDKKDWNSIRYTSHGPAINENKLHSTQIKPFNSITCETIV